MKERLDDIKVTSESRVPGTLADRYHELMAFRREVLARFRANEMSVIAGPRPHLTFPNVGLGDGPARKRLGPLRFNDRWPLMPFIDEAIGRLARPGPITILEIGPGRGELAEAILTKHGAVIGNYVAYDRDPTVRGPYARVESLEQAPGDIDVVIASEVIEHMSADEFYEDLLSTIAPKLTPNAAFILSTPNPLAPGGVARDFSHRQGYPWYDLYAILRLLFDDVEIRRSFYLFDPKRIFQLIPRFVLCSLLELEFCDGLVAVAQNPRVAAVQKEL